MIRPFVRLILIPCCLIATSNLAFAQIYQIDSLQSVLKTLPDDTNRVNTLIYLCRAQTPSSTEKMEVTAREALLLARKIHFGKGEANAHVYLALYSKKVGDAPKAIEYLLNALEYYEKSRDTGHAAMCFNNIGVIYLDQDELDQAMDYFRKAYVVWERMNSKSGIVRALNNIASVYEKEKNDSLALDFYNRALKPCEEIHDKAFTSQILGSIGMIHLRMKKYASSMKFQERALALAVETNDVARQAQSYGAMSEIYAALGQPEKALVIAKKGLEHSLKITSKNDLLDSYGRVYKAFEKLKDYRMAFEFQSRYMALRDSLKHSENVVAMERLKSKYELDKKEVEITMLTQRHESSVSRRNTFVVALSGILVITFLLYNRYRLITQRRLSLKKQRLTLYTQALIEKSETISRINLELEEIKSNGSTEDLQIAKLNKLLQTNILTDEDWENFKKAFEELYPSFFFTLRRKYPAVTTSELRLSALMKLNLSTKEIASMLGISPDSVKTSRYRFKKKLGLAENESAEEFIERLEIR